MMRLNELGMTTLEERHHEADMHMVHKIMHAESGLEPGTWFKRAGNAPHMTRNGADPFNIKAKTGRLEVRRQFFSMRVINDWNNIPADMKSRPGTASFKAAHKKLRARPAHPATPMSSTVTLPGSPRTILQVKEVSKCGPDPNPTFSDERL